MSSSDLLDSAKSNHVESGEATFTKINNDVNIKPNVKLIGLTKEELEKYRNDPFWRVVRYAMFALFWLVWLAMFAGAILIVVISPKCNKGNVSCGNNLVNYRIFVPAFRDSDGDGVGDLAGVQEKLEMLKSVGVSGISPTPLFTTIDEQFAPETVTDLDIVDLRIGGIDQLKALITAAHNLGLCFIADIPLALSAQNAEFKDSFIEEKDDSGILDVSKTVVIDKLTKVAKNLINLGVDGLRFTTYELTTQSDKFTALNNVVANIRKSAENDKEAEGKKLAIFVEHSLGDIVSSANYSDFPLYNGDTQQDDTDMIAQLEEIIFKGVRVASINVTNKPKPNWRVGDVDSPRFGKYIPIQLLQLILPGPVSIYYGEDIGLLSVPLADGRKAQRGAMRWNSDLPTFGFSQNASASFYTNYTFNFLSTNFNDELANANSQLNAFKNATAVRLHPEDKFKQRKIAAINYYARITDDNKVPNFVLAVNWQSSGKARLTLDLLDQFKKKCQVNKAIIKTHSPEMTDVPVDLTNDNELELGPFKAVLFLIGCY